MASAVWQGFCSLLRDPPPPFQRLAACTAPSPGGSWAAMAPSWGSPRLPRRPRKAAKMDQHASNTAKDGSKRAQDGPMTAQDGLKRAQRGPQDGFRGLHEEPLESTKKQKQSIFMWFFIDFWLLAFLGFRQYQTAQEASRIAPRGPRRAPKLAKMCPRWPQKKPKRALRRAITPRESLKLAHDGVRKDPKAA